MNYNKLTCEKARNISIVPTLGKLGHFPKRQTDKEAWFLSPFRSETQASFKVSKKLNRWYDHGENFGGNIIDLIIKLHNCAIKEALQFLSEYSSFSFQEQKKDAENNIKKEYSEKQYEVLKIKNLENMALIDYLKSRSINIEVAKNYCQEIYYKIKDKNYFAIGFKNSNNGYEIRNKYFKGCIGNKSITMVKNGASKLMVFEGFLDFLSYQTLFKKEYAIKEDYIICNSVGLVKNTLPELKKYDLIYGCLDNDNAGSKASLFLKNNHLNFMDCRFCYHQCKDFNEYLQKRGNLEIERRSISKL